VTSSPTPPEEEQPPVVTQQVTVKRGCSICGCGCIIPAFVVPIMTLAFWGTLGEWSCSKTAGRSLRSHRSTP
jgi:hypothetical protein